MQRNIGSPRQRHPLRDVRACAVGLKNDQEVVDTQPRAAKYLDLLAYARVERITDANELCELFAGSMSLLRPALGKSHLALRHRPRARRAGLSGAVHAHQRTGAATAGGPPSLRLPQALAKLDRYDLLILDDIVYVRKDQAETSVLFELIAERYERRSILITANQPFSGWDNVFPDPGMTVAAIDRLVHHSTIFELQQGRELPRQSRRPPAENSSATTTRPSASVNHPTSTTTIPQEAASMTH